MPKKLHPELAANPHAGVRIREARRSRPNLSQQRLATKVGVTRETICRIESGRKAHPLVLMKIATELGLDPTPLFPRGDIPGGLAHSHVGIALRTRRLDQGLSLAQCAASAGVSGSTLSRFERGMRCRKLMGGHPYRPPYNRGYVAALGFASPQQLAEFITAAWSQGSRLRAG